MPCAANLGPLTERRSLLTVKTTTESIFPSLLKFRVRYFSSIDWKWIELDSLAFSVDQVRAFADSECSPQYRNIPYRGLKDNEQRPFVDSLTIGDGEPVAVPYVIGS